VRRIIIITSGRTVLGYDAHRAAIADPSIKTPPSTKKHYSADTLLTPQEEDRCFKGTIRKKYTCFCREGEQMKELRQQVDLASEWALRNFTGILI